MEESVTFKVGRFSTYFKQYRCSVRLKPELPVSLSVKPSLIGAVLVTIYLPSM